MLITIFYKQYNFINCVQFVKFGKFSKQRQETNQHIIITLVINANNNQDDGFNQE